MSTISRRSALRTFGLLGAAVVGGAAGLLRPVHHKVALPPAPPPDALVIALSDSARLHAAYAAAVTRDTANAALLTNLMADVDAHSAALRALLEQYPGWRYEQGLASSSPSRTASATPYPSPASGPAIAPDGTSLRTALAAVASAAASACANWPAAEAHAAEAVGLLASISATLTTHVQVLS